MRGERTTLVLLAMGWLCGCGPGLSPPFEQARAALRLEPERPAEAATPVVRLRIDTWTDPASLRLFRDELSDYHLGRVRADDLPTTLLGREVSTLAFAGSGTTSSAPLEILPAGIYSLASAALGLIGAFTVTGQDAPPLFARRWPPAGAVGSAALYCGDEHEGQDETLALDPSGAPATVSAGVAWSGLFAERCLWLELESPLLPGELALPPPSVAGVLLDPALLLGGNAAPELEPGCPETETALGFACAAAGDDRLVVWANQPVLLAFSEPHAALVVLDAPGQSGVIRGLRPAATVRVSGLALDLSGRGRTFETIVETLPPRPRLVVSEVLANPNGPEPGGEWIELFNDGTDSADLGGYRLQDGGGEVSLPARHVAPGEYVVLVSEDYVADPALDVAPADPSVFAVLPVLAKNGLSNGGELIRLLSADGTPVSRFPALKAATAGVSLARRAADSADDDPAAFGLHAAPGASPGAPNLLAE